MDIELVRKADRNIRQTQTSIASGRITPPLTLILTLTHNIRPSTARAGGDHPAHDGSLKANIIHIPKGKCLTCWYMDHVRPQHVHSCSCLSLLEGKMRKPSSFMQRDFLDSVRTVNNGGMNDNMLGGQGGNPRFNMTLILTLILP